MDNSLPQQGSQTQQRRGFRVGVQILNRFENWLGRLAQLAQLTEEEQNEAGIHLTQLMEEPQKDAGIYIGEQRFE